jgi:hypothetical protein
VRSLLLLFVALLGAGCTPVGQRLEQGGAISVPENLKYGGRVWLGMPKGRNRVLVTQLSLSGQIDGFFAAAGGVAVRSDGGMTPRASIGLGVGGRSFSPDTNGKNGLSGYGEALVGWDFAVSDDVTIALQVIGTLYLNGDTLEPHVLGALGLVWK